MANTTRTPGVTAAIHTNLRGLNLDQYLAPSSTIAFSQLGATVSSTVPIALTTTLTATELTTLTTTLTTTATLSELITFVTNDVMNAINTNMDTLANLVTFSASTATTAVMGALNRNRFLINQIIDIMQNNRLATTST